MQNAAWISFWDFIYFFLSKADQTSLRLVLVYVLTSFLFGCLHTQNDGNSRGLAWHKATSYWKACFEWRHPRPQEGKRKPQRASKCENVGHSCYPWGENILSCCWKHGKDAHHSQLQRVEVCVSLTFFLSLNRDSSFTWSYLEVRVGGLDGDGVAWTTGFLWRAIL